MGWMTERSEFKARQGQELFPLHIVHTGTVANPATYLMGTGGSILGEKRPDCEANRSHVTSAEVKNTWIYISTSAYAFMA
jgi:hypothetical protein